MIKPIKFDLKLHNGTTTLRTLDDLEENLTPALFEHFHSGKLAKWLRVRKLEELAEKVEALSTQHLNDKNELEVKLFKNLCEIFVSEVSEDDAHEAIEHYKTVEPSSENSNDEEVEQLKAEIEALKTEIELLKNQSIGENERKTANDGQPEWVDETVIENDDELLKLLEEGDETQRAEIASLPNLSATLQNKLLEDSAESVLVALAKNESLTDEIQTKLANEGTLKIREALAKNVSITSAIQSILLKDEWLVRKSLASNPSLDLNFHSKLMTDNVEMKVALACNPSLPEKFQQEIALTNRKNEPEFTRGWVIRSLAKNIALSETVMKILAVKETDVKEVLASNLSLPEFLQARLIQDNSGNVREILAKNPSLQIQQQAELFEVGNRDVRLALFDNESLSDVIKTKIIDSLDRCDLDSCRTSYEWHTENEKNTKKENDVALDKWIDYEPYGLFSSIEKYERLKSELDSASQLHTEQIWKLSKLEHQIQQLELILGLKNVN
jgi:hypothetical protein